MPIHSICFSFPTSKIRPVREKNRTYCLIEPGNESTYVQGEETYMDTLGTSAFCSTKPKWGWDCWRHLEILAAGSVPIFDELESCPKTTLVQYPKAELLKRERADSQVLRDHFLRHLTCSAMNRYVLETLGWNDPQVPRILFLDDALPKCPDYLSLSVLIGLKERFGSAIDVPFEVDYLYESWSGNARTVGHGNGVNYTRVLSETRHSSVSVDECLSRLKNGEYDMIWFGSMTRGSSTEWYRTVSAYMDPDRIVLFLGEDYPLSYWSQCQPYRTWMETHPTFVREWDAWLSSHSPEPSEMVWDKFVRSIPSPPISQRTWASPRFDQPVSLVIVEPTRHPWFRGVVRNMAYAYSGKDVPLYVFYGPENETWIRDQMSEFQGIQFRNIGIENMKIQPHYNELLSSINAFYDQFQTEHVLVFQSDTLLAREIPRFYYQYDYSGAPIHFPKGEAYERFCKGHGIRFPEIFVGNGGFSLRRVSTMRYWSRLKTETHPILNEDLYFSACVQHKPLVKEAMEFAVEKCAMSRPCGFHKAYAYHGPERVRSWLYQVGKLCRIELS